MVDTGTGIAKEDFPKLFTRFGKLHRTAIMNSEGIGLGLTMVKQIVESSGGQIAFESQGIGHGSNFCFSMTMDSENGQDQGEQLNNDPLNYLIADSSSSELISVKKEILKSP